MNKQEFVLNGVMEAIRKDGAGTDLGELANTLIGIYDSVSNTPLMERPVTEPNQSPIPETAKEGSTLPAEASGASCVNMASTPSDTGDAAQQFDQAVTQDVPDPAGEPTAPTDDWGLPWDETWNAGGHGKTKNGNFKRKPGTNEEDYAHWLKSTIEQAQADGTFAGPDNWKIVARVNKYLPDEPPAPTLQDQARTPADATTPPTVPDPEPHKPVDIPDPAPVGTAQAAGILDLQKDVMPVHVKFVGAFTPMNPLIKQAMFACGADSINLMTIPDNNREIYVQLVETLVAQKESIELDQTGTKVPEIFGMFGLTAE